MSIVLEETFFGVGFDLGSEPWCEYDLRGAGVDFGLSQTLGAKGTAKLYYTSQLGLVWDRKMIYWDSSQSVGIHPNFVPSQTPTIHPS